MAQVIAAAMASAMAAPMDGEMTYHHSTPLHCLLVKFRVKSRSDSLRNHPDVNPSSSLNLSAGWWQ